MKTTNENLKVIAKYVKDHMKTKIEKYNDKYSIIL